MRTAVLECTENTPLEEGSYFLTSLQLRSKKGLSSPNPGFGRTEQRTAFSGQSAGAVRRKNAFDTMSSGYLLLFSGCLFGEPRESLNSSKNKRRLKEIRPDTGNSD